MQKVNYFRVNSPPLRVSDGKNPILLSHQPSEDTGNEAVTSESRCANVWGYNRTNCFGSASQFEGGKKKSGALTQDKCE